MNSVSDITIELYYVLNMKVKKKMNTFQRFASQKVNIGILTGMSWTRVFL